MELHSNDFDPVIDMNVKNDYQRMIEKIQKLPSLPIVAMKLMKVVNASETSADDAATLIEKDPALTSAVLRIANSTLYGNPRSISSITSAVVILGFNAIRTIVLSQSLMQSFSQKKKYSAFNRKRFWQHSITCAVAAKLLSKRLQPTIMIDPESVFCAGILHDIGKLIFDELEPQKYSSVCTYAQQKAISLRRAEREKLGITHTEIGRILSDKWALPDILEHSIVYHHNPQFLEKINELVSIVHVADYMTHAIGINLWDDEVTDEEWGGSRLLLDLDDNAFELCCDDLEKSVETSHVFFTPV